MAHSLASAAGVAEEHLAPRALGGPAGLADAEQPVERGGHLPARLGAEQVRHVQQRAGLLGERVGHRRVAVAEARDGEAGQEVEVALPSSSQSQVPSPRTNCERAAAP